MLIQFAKGKEGKPEVLTCVREDGSRTWQISSDYFVRHDLIHYVVESTLGYREAFLGLVAQGRDLDAFGTRDGKKDVYTQEEGWAEGIVGLLQWPSSGGGPALSDAELQAMLEKTCTDRGVSIPSIRSEQLASIRAQVRTLHEHWDRLPAGAKLELEF